MKHTDATGSDLRRVLLVGPAPPPYGGMALQGQKLATLLRLDGFDLIFLASNLVFPAGLRAVDGVPALRTVVRFVLLCIRILAEVRKAHVIHVLAASWVYFFAAVCPAVVVGRLFRRRVVVNYRGGEADRFFQSFGWIVRPIFAMADVITVPSQYLARVFEKHFGITAAIVPNILDTRMFRYRQRMRFRPNIVTARHLEQMYDVESVLRAFRLVQESYPDATLTIAGTGSQEGHLRSLASGWNLSNVRFVGGVRQDELPSFYDECDIFLNASRVDNFPGALLEASAAGLAVVSTAAGGIPCIYDNGETAWLVQPGDWQGLAGAVLKVLDAPEVAHLTTKAAAELVRAFEWREVRGLLLDAYGFADQVARTGDCCRTPSSQTC